MKSQRNAFALFCCVGALHLPVILAGFLSPSGYLEQNRAFPYAPPSRLHFVDHQGKFHLRPAICRLVERPGAFATYDEDPTQCLPLQFLVRGEPYKLLGVFECGSHLFEVSSPSTLFLLGTDGYGRDVFSRLLYGGQLSLFCGLLAATLSLGLGSIMGIVAGFYGGWLDSVIMRGCELFLALPWLYLLFAVRAFLPLHIDPKQTFLLLIAVVGTVGWARPARLVRGIVLSGKERAYVAAARSFGGSDIYLMRTHIMPQTYGVLITQAAILIPHYVIAEVVLSFLGLGVSEPVPSWGNMLATLQQYDVLVSYWWMWAPGFALMVVSFIYLALANVMQERCGLHTVAK